MKSFNDVKWSFTAGNFNAKRGPLWTTSSPAIYPSKGAALFFAHAECRKHGCPPVAVYVQADEYCNGSKVTRKFQTGSLAFAL